MYWEALLLSMVGLYATIKLLTLYRSERTLKFLGLGAAGIFFILIQVSILIEGILSGYNLTIHSSFIVEWSHVLCLSLVLSALAVFIRESKPVFAQFPALYSALPLLIVVSYVLVKDTYAIKEWLISIYQGGAILVGILMYSVYTYRKNEFAPVLAGVVLFLITFILYWYVPSIRDSYTWIWKLFLGTSIVVLTQGLAKVHRSAGMPAIQ